MMEIPREFPLPDGALERQRSLLGAYVEAGRHAALPGRRRRLTVLAVAVLALVVLTATALGMRVFVLHQGFIGLPPVGATPSAPQSGDLVVHWWQFSGTLPEVHPGYGHGPVVGSWVYADGRMIWYRQGQVLGGANELSSGYLEQRLTPEGVELVRSAVAELFDRSRTLLDRVPADDVAPGVEVPDGDHLLRLDEMDTHALTAEQLSALRRVDALLTDPSSVLPASAWAERQVKAYVPSHYAVCISTGPPRSTDHVLSLLPAKAAALLHGTSPTVSEYDLQEGRAGGVVVVVGRAARYCFRVETEQAREVARALSGLEPERGVGSFLLAYRVAEPGVGGQAEPTVLAFEPYLPHGQHTFSWPVG